LEPILALPTIQHLLRVPTSDCLASRHPDGITILPIVVIREGTTGDITLAWFAKQTGNPLYLERDKFLQSPMIWENFRD
jgi:hypothetical protein